MNEQFRNLLILTLIIAGGTFLMNKNFLKEKSHSETYASVPQDVQSKQKTFYLQAPWRDEYETAVNDYVNSSDVADEVLMAGLLKKLGKYEVKIRSVFDPPLAETNESSRTSTRINGYTFIFENIHKGEGPFEMTSRIVARKDNKTVFQKDLDFGMIDVTLIESLDTSYLMAYTYTGGSHCCVEILPIAINQKNVSAGGILSAGDAASGDASKFFIKDDRLYFILRDDRFGYFHTDYVGSRKMFLPFVYYIDKNTGETIEATDEFINEYQKMISVLDLAVDKIEKYDKEKIRSVFENAVSIEYAHLNPTLRLFAASQITENSILVNGIAKKYKEDLSFFLGNNQKLVSDALEKITGERSSDETY